MGRESEVKFPEIGDSISFGKYTGRITRIYTTPGFYKNTRVKIEFNLDWEELANDKSDKKSKRRTARKKTATVKRKD